MLMVAMKTLTTRKIRPCTRDFLASRAASRNKRVRSGGPAEEEAEMPRIAAIVESISELKSLRTCN